MIDVVELGWFIHYMRFWSNCPKIHKLVSAIRSMISETEEIDALSSQNLERGVHTRGETSVVRDEICRRLAAHYGILM